MKALCTPQKELVIEIGDGNGNLIGSFDLLDQEGARGYCKFFESMDGKARRVIRLGPTAVAIKAVHGIRA